MAFTNRSSYQPCCSYELTHGHAYSVFKYQLLLLRSPQNFSRGETTDYTELNLSVNCRELFFQTFLSSSKTSNSAAINNIASTSKVCQTAKRKFNTNMRFFIETLIFTGFESRKNMVGRAMRTSVLSNYPTGVHSFGASNTPKTGLLSQEIITFTLDSRKNND